MEFELIAGHPVLDLVNTLDNRGREDETEGLVEYADFLRFALETGVVSHAQARRISRARAAAALSRAIDLRERVHEVFLPLSLGANPPAAEVERLSEHARRAFAHRVLQRRGSEFEWRWDDPQNPEWPVWSLALSAAELLLRPERARVRSCESETCRWLFLDQSKNGSRRWCDMKMCGNRAKARRHYQRGKTVSR